MSSRHSSPRTPVKCLAFALMLAACGSEGGNPETDSGPAPDSPPRDSGQRDALVDGPLDEFGGPIFTCRGLVPGPSQEAEVGTSNPAGDFVAYESEALLILGHQGGYMITPIFRIPAPEGAPETTCVHIAIRNSVNASSALGYRATLTATLDGDDYLIRRVENLLGYELSTLDEGALTMDITLTANEFSVDETIELVLTTP